LFLQHLGDRVVATKGVYLLDCTKRAGNVRLGFRLGAG